MKNTTLKIEILVDGGMSTKREFEIPLFPARGVPALISRVDDFMREVYDEFYHKPLIDRGKA